LRFATVRTPEGTRAARLDGEELVLLDHPDVTALLASSGGWRGHVGQEGSRVGLEDAALAPLLPAPEKIVCIGLNYRSHAEETGLAIPEYPAIFSKYSRALIGARDQIALPPSSELVDWEAELAIVIGAEVRRADERQATDAIAGYTVANDISMRDWQRRTPQWVQGKTFERSTPVGPFLVTSDEVGDPLKLRVICEVDDQVVQDASTAELIFSPAALVAYVSEIITLVPGDLILTGTPSGIGAARKPPQFLAAGSLVRTRIDGLGELLNECRPETDDAR
jgi:acylpyruvate hydrolase